MGTPFPLQSGAPRPRAQRSAQYVPTGAALGPAGRQRTEGSKLLVYIVLPEYGGRRMTQDGQGIGEGLAGPALPQLGAYHFDVPRCRVQLADNTSAFGAPPSALAAVRDAGTEQLVRYPSPFSESLRRAIADYIGVTPDEIVLGCGSDDVLDCAFRAFGSPGDRVAHIAPTFVMARVFALTNHLRPLPVPLTPTWDVDADAVIAARAPITYLCSPNNPTGGNLSSTAVDRILAETTGVIILDEAYAEYAGRTRSASAPSHGRLLVLRTFSKAFGLAGLRIGYGVASAALIADLERVRGPYKVSSLAEAAALAVLSREIGWVRQAAAETVRLRDAFSAALRVAGFSPLPSAANFVLVPVADARLTAGALLEHGILVREFPGLPGVGDAIRISIGRAEVMDQVILALREAAR